MLIRLWSRFWFVFMGAVRYVLTTEKKKKIVPLEKPYEGLYVPPGMWREMFDFSPDAVLLVLASEYYDESDYIRDYDEFKKFIKGAEKHESI